MWLFTCIAFLTATACQGQIIRSSLDDRSFIDFSHARKINKIVSFTPGSLTYITTIFVASTTTLSTVTTCISLSSTTACSGRRRRGIVFSDEEYFGDKPINPSAVLPAETIATPETSDREGREAHYFDYVPYFPRYNLHQPAISPFFRHGQTESGDHSEVRNLLSLATSTFTVYSGTSTLTTYTGTVTKILLCSDTFTLSTCPPISTITTTTTTSTTTSTTTTTTTTSTSTSTSTITTTYTLSIFNYSTTFSLISTTWSTISTTCTVLVTNTPCSGKRRRRGIIALSAEQELEGIIIRPSNIDLVEVTAAPVLPEELESSTELNDFTEDPIQSTIDGITGGSFVKQIFRDITASTTFSTVSIVYTATTTSTSTSTISIGVLCSAPSSYSSCTGG